MRIGETVVCNAILESKKYSTMQHELWQNSLTKQSKSKRTIQEYFSLKIDANSKTASFKSNFLVLIKKEGIQDAALS